MEFILFLLQIVFGVDIEQYDYVWVPRNDTYVKVPIVFEVSGACKEKGYMHCYISGPNEQIQFTLDKIWYIDSFGCNGWTHEVLHAWGYHHIDMAELKLCS